MHDNPFYNVRGDLVHFFCVKFVSVLKLDRKLKKLLSIINFRDIISAVVYTTIPIIKKERNYG
jgi:hypothetical protein